VALSGLHQTDTDFHQLLVIEQAVPLMVDGSILRYRYGHRACAIVEANKG
jgi:hypothetical protein